MDENIIKRTFNTNYTLWKEYNEKWKEYNEEDILNYIQNKKDNYIITAYGGMGKSFVAKRWSNKLKDFTLVKAQTITKSSIKNNIIIDNFDEVELSKSKAILKWISNFDYKNIIIFSRPENVLDKISYFQKITMTNLKNINPRYEKMKIVSESYTKFVQYFKKTLKLNEIHFDFLSILSFNLLTKGVIYINKNDFFEFIRKYNINNNSHITVEEFLNNKKEIFKEIKNDIYFENKTIPSFFVIGFLKKFAHIQNSFLSYFNDYTSQIAFAESAKILVQNTENNSMNIAWNLVSKNQFFFMFLSTYENTSTYKNTYYLIKILNHGSPNLEKDKFTKLFSQIQIHCFNSKYFYDFINIYSGEEDFFKNFNYSYYLKQIWNGIIKNDYAKKEIVLFFLRWMISFLPKNKEKYEEIIKIINSFIQKKWKNIQNEEIGDHKMYQIEKYAFNFSKNIKDIDKEFYEGYSSMIENTIEYLITFNCHEKAIELITHFDFKKIVYSYEKDAINNFMNWIIKNKKFIFLLQFLRASMFKIKINIKWLKKIPPNEIKLLIDKIKKNYKKIHISKKYREKLINQIKPDLHYGNNFDNLFFVEKTKKTKINKFLHIKSIVIKNDLKDISKLKWEKYINYESNNFYKNIHNLKIVGNISQDFVDKIIKDINKYIECNSSISNFWNIEPVLQILGFIPKINFKILSPIVLIHIMNQNSTYTLNYNSENNWWNQIKCNEENKIIKYFNNIEKFSIIVKKCEYQYLDKSIIIKILDSMLKKDRLQAIKILYKFELLKFGLQSWFVYNKYYNESSFAKQAAQEMKWWPKNITIIIENIEKFQLLKKSKQITLKRLKEIIENLINADFFSWKKLLGSLNINWYDYYFFSVDITTKHLKSLYKILNDNNLIDWFYPKFQEIFQKSFSMKLKSEFYKRIIYDFINVFMNLKALSSKIIWDKKIKEIISFLNSTNYITQFEQAWFNINKETIHGEKNPQVFKITQFYRYLNENMNILEFKHLFKTDIKKIIKSLVKKIPNENSRFETEAHKELNKFLPQILMNKYSIIYQPESNPYSPKRAKKRIDFILSIENKFIFVELKSLSGQLNIKKLTWQLSNYEDDYGLIKSKMLLIFVNKKIKETKRHNITKGAESVDFETIFIELV